uniref:Uncharacterized protein n=1 Tax=Leptocylindrus danicus TaxID=163516 RepID=A0A7S2K6L2_9STRA
MSSALHAKRRRKRKDSPDSSSNSSVGPSSSFNDNFDDELPDFDLNEDVDESSSSKERSTSSSSSAPAQQQLSMQSDLSDAMSDPSVMAAMRGSASSMSSAKDARDVLRARNREVEATFEFDEVANPLPRPGQAKGSVGGGEVIGKKRAKAEARRAAAIERAQLEEEEGLGSSAVFSSISNLVTGEATDGGIPKIIETGTWAGIFVLVLWEVYINSPFFERVQPMIPVVYDLLN